MIVNLSGTGGAISVFGVLSAPQSIPPSTAFNGGTLFRQSDAFADFFFYSGQVYYAGGCCGSFSVLGLSGTWEFDFDPDIPPLPGQGVPTPRTDYTNLIAPPDIPEPSTVALLGIGGCILLLRRTGQR